MDDAALHSEILPSCGRCGGFANPSPISLVELEQGMNEDCNLCTVIFNSITKYKDTLMESQSRLLDELDRVILVDQKTVGFGFELRNSENASSDAAVTFEVFLPASDSSINAKIPRNYLPRDVPSCLEPGRLLDLVQKWIASCDRRHSRCALPDYTLLPKRVLDISSRDNEPVKLLELNGVHAPYIALSYCWGQSKEHLKTTSESLPNHIRGIPWNLFPQTFKDVIGICKQLKIRYLWIDALCIIQDSVEDWEIESAKMAEVYANSYLTISAASCADSNASLYANRWTSIRANNTMEFRTGPGSVTVEHKGRTFLARPKLHLAHARFQDLDNAHHHSEDAPLLTRAWAYQERILPTRTLHFHAEELVWECNTRVRCECGNMDETLLKVAEQEDSDKTDLSKFVQSISGEWLKSLFANINQADTTHEELCSIWMDVLSEYTRLNLTFESDRLAALSGLASKFTTPFFGNYFAGMWVGMFPTGLLYESIWKPGDFASPLPQQPQAPSWSWASIPLSGTNGISYDRAFDAYPCPEFSVHKVTGKVLGKNPFGWVKWGVLSIRVKSVRCFVVQGPDNTLGLKRRASHMTLPEHEDLMTLLPDTPSVGTNPRVVFLLLAKGIGLAVQRTSSRDEPARYRRVGIAIFDTDSTDWEEHMTVKNFDLV